MSKHLTVQLQVCFFFFFEFGFAPFNTLLDRRGEGETWNEMHYMSPDRSGPGTLLTVQGWCLNFWAIRMK